MEPPPFQIIRACPSPAGPHSHPLCDWKCATRKVPACAPSARSPRGGRRVPHLQPGPASSPPPQHIRAAVAKPHPCPSNSSSSSSSTTTTTTITVWAPLVPRCPSGGLPPWGRCCPSHPRLPPSRRQVCARRAAGCCVCAKKRARSCGGASAYTACSANHFFMVWNMQSAGMRKHEHYAGSWEKMGTVKWRARSVRAACGTGTVQVPFQPRVPCACVCCVPLPCACQPESALK